MNRRVGFCSAEIMNLLRPASFRLAVCGPARYSKWRTLEALQTSLTNHSPNICSSFAAPSSGTRFVNSHKAVFDSAYRTGTKEPILQLHAARRFSTSKASTRIITRFNDVPKDYEDSTGLAYRVNPLSQREADKIFGRSLGPRNADRILRVLHGRRVAGTLPDPNLPTPVPQYDENIHTIALAWLRKNVPVDEEYTAAKRAKLELAAMEAERFEESHRLGIYKPAVYESGPNDRPDGNLYGKSGINAIRNTYQQQFDEQDRVEKTRQAQAKEVGSNTGIELTTPVRSRVELRRPGENPRLKHYIERAANVVPEIPPEMSAWQRLWPSGLVVLGVVGASVLFAQVYVPPTSSARLWPDVPPAAATIISLIVANSVVWVAWHTPPAWRLLNKYFMSVPAYPRALAMLGNVFSHQAVGHLLMNMMVLWFIGTRLHDDIGRANFLAVYLSSGVISSFASLANFTARRVFVTSSLGASGAIAGVVASYLWLHRDGYFKFLGLPHDPWKGVPGLTILALVVIMDTIGYIRTRKGGIKYDHVSHLAGYSTGILGAEYIRKNVRRKRVYRREKTAPASPTRS